MKPLIVLLVSFTISSTANKLVKGRWNAGWSARFAMSVMLVFTAAGHFIFAEGMAMMMPDFIPFRGELVYFTGIIEIAAAIGLHVSGLRKLTAWLLILFFILVLPANIKAATEQINYQTATFDGKGITYLWFRIPLQILFIGWVYMSSIRVAGKNRVADAVKV